MCCRKSSARASGTSRPTNPAGFPWAAKVSATSISVFSANALVYGLKIRERSRATAYCPCCERASVVPISFQSRMTRSVASTSSFPPSSARMGSAALVLLANASATERWLSAEPLDR